MTQNAFKVDQLQIEPGVTGTRLIRAEPGGTGKMQLWDADATAGVTLAQLAGVAVDNLFIVGSAGVGAKYTTVKDALDVIRAGYPTNAGPFLILVFPGTYLELGTLVIDVDNVFIQGLGGVTIGLDAALTNVDTFRLQSGTYSSTTYWPQRVGISNVRILNNQTGYSCVNIVGGDIGVDASKTGLNGIFLDRIDWVATGLALAVKAVSAGHVRMTGGSMLECAGANNKVQVDTCASFVAEGVLDGSSFQLDLDTSNEVPYGGVSSSIYRMKSCTLSALVSTLTGAGALDLQACDGSFTVTFGGAARKAHFIGCKAGAISLSGTVQLAVSGTTYASLAQGGTSAASAPVLMGFNTVLPATETSVSVTIPRQPDTNYVASVSMYDDYTPTTWKVLGRTTTTFTVEFTTVDAVNDRHFDWAVLRTVTNL